MGARAPAGAARAAAALLVVALAGCGGERSSGPPTYTGHARAATVVLSVVARKPVTAWQLSVRFTKAGAALHRRVQQLHVNAFCLSGKTLVEGGIGATDLREDAIEVPRFLDLPEPKEWVCGLHDAQDAQSRTDYVAHALLAVTLTRT